MDESPEDSFVSALLADALEPLFWPPTRLGVDSAWLGHVPFGHWLVGFHRPASIIELGTRSGVSFAAFCEAAVRCNIDTHARAFTMRGEPKSDSTACTALRQFLDQRYAAALLDATPEEALDTVPDASVDLLHINDAPLDRDLARMFADWLPKLSSRAIVLVHGINPGRERGDAWRLWTDISARHPHFAFDHAGGLGMLVLGDATRGAAALCVVSGKDAARVRQRFFVAGCQWAALQALDREAAISAGLRSKIAALQSELDGRDAQMAVQVTRSTDAEARSACLASEVDHLKSCLQAARTELGAFSQEIIAYEHEREAFLKSTSWRLTAPLRRLIGKRR